MTTVVELRNIAKGLGIRGYSTANKARLIELLENHDKKVAENDKSTPEHVKIAEKDPEVEAFEKAVGEKVEHVPKKKRQANAWNAFLKDRVKSTGCTLKQAMAAKEEYAKYKESWKRPEEEESE